MSDDVDKTANTEATHVEVEDLLRNIRNQFYTDVPLKKFLQDRNVLLLAVTWPATWLKERGISWPSDRYFQTLLSLLQEVKRHGATGQIKYFPGYLAKVIQDHFAHHSDEYCDQGKRDLHAWEKALGTALGAARAAQVREAEQLTNTLAAAHQVLAMKRRPAKAPKTDDSQGSLF